MEKNKKSEFAEPRELKKIQWMCKDSVKKKENIRRFNVDEVLKGELVKLKKIRN
jgi:hypothetical protein